MNLSNLISGSNVAKNLGVKCIVYGQAGSGKTPLATTAPNALILATESGLLSLRNDNTTPIFEAYTPELIDEFFNWFFGSSESRQFETLVIDSLSQLAELYLARAKSKTKHDLQAYGFMANDVMQIVNALYYAKGINIVMNCKEALFQVENVTLKRPYFAGKDLNVKVPHLFDEILHIGHHYIKGKQTWSIKTKGDAEIMARDRSLRLDEFEEPNLTKIFNKCKS